jgi:pimeloyl-ACP methyl ester carboxylesterase
MVERRLWTVLGGLVIVSGMSAVCSGASDHSISERSVQIGDDAQKTPYLVYTPSKDSGLAKHPLIVYLYGRGGSIRDYNLKNPAYAKLVQMAAERGYYIVVPELGESHWMGDRAKKTLDAILADVMKTCPIDPKRVHMMGTSMGGGSSFAYAIHRPDLIRSVCAVCPMTDFAQWAASSPYLASVAATYGGSPADAPDAWAKASAMKNLDTFKNIPVFLVHGTADNLVPPEQSRQLAKALQARNHRVTLRESQGAGHEDRIVEPFQKEIIDFFDNATSFVYVCRDAGAGGYQAFPDVCRLPDGRLMAAFYAGYGHLAAPNAQWPKGGRISYCISSDEGHTWSRAETLFDGFEDNRDPSLVQLKSGRVLCNYFDLRYETKPVQRWIGKGTWIVASDDGGKTWSTPQHICDDYYCSSPIRVLSTGRLIMPLYREDAKSAAGAVTISDDDGKTWSKPIDIDNGGHRLDAETDIIELRDGTLYAAERGNVMCYSISKDQGKTWSVSKPIGFPGHCPYLLRSQGNVVVLAYRDITTASTCLRYSRDECKTWSEAVVVDKLIGAYPSLVNLKDGSVLIIYYEEGPNSSIRAKRFRIDNAGVTWLAP